MPAIDAWPVGSVFIGVVSTSPATLLGGGTWAQIAQGRVLVGQDIGDTAFDTLEETGGAQTHTHAAHSDVINHTHPVTDTGHVHPEQAPSSASAGALKFGIDTNASGSQAAGIDTASAVTGVTTTNPVGGVAELTHDSSSSLPPYLVVAVWKRTA